MGVLLIAVSLAAVVFGLATSGMIVAPDFPRSGPEAWVARDDRRQPCEQP